MLSKAELRDFRELLRMADTPKTRAMAALPNSQLRYGMETGVWPVWVRYPTKAARARYEAWMNKGAAKGW